ncbi:MAG: hypothetical protein HFI76_08360 [Lachnospiraceae bacterium]|nr:hypothetical protein [Lachnospiraceae bacterium]
MEKKKLVVNCGTCDIRKIQKEVLDTYETITIHAGTVITNPKAQSLTAPYDLHMDCGNVLQLEEDVEAIQVNGVYRIKRGDKIPEKRLCISINGKLIIEGGTEDILKKFALINVNGKVICPSSMLSALPMLQINGKTESYPDDAVLVDSTFILDQVFVLRAKQKNYYASSLVVLADEKLNMEKLLASGAHFLTPRALVLESLLEQAVGLFEEETKIEVLPQGMHYVDDDITLGRKEVRKLGTRLYVDGDVHLKEQEALEALEQLIVKGKLFIPQELEEAVWEKENQMEYEELVVQRGVWLTDKLSVTVDQRLLDQNSGEIFINDVVEVKISPEVSAKDIQERLHFSDCAKIVCAKEQISAVETVAQDVAYVGTHAADEMGFWDEVSGRKDTKVIQAGSYVF